jgi:hypothetical protein
MRESKLWLWVKRVRTVAAWIVVPAFLIMFMAHQHLIYNFPTPFPSGVERPNDLEVTLMWRNYSFLVVAAASLISSPRWQSLLGIVATIVFLFLYGSQ